MAIQPHIINYKTKRIHYRGGQYPFRRISYYSKEESDRKINSLVSSETLDKIINSDGVCGIDDIIKASVEIDKKVDFFVSDSLFQSPGVVIKDVLERGNKDFVFTHVADF